MLLLLVYRDMPPRRRQIMAMVAYACRYGHQHRADMLQLTLDELSEFNNALADILREESPFSGEDR